jgi:hypothetical protein
MNSNKKQLNIKLLLNTAANEEVRIDSITALPDAELVEESFFEISNTEVDTASIIASLTFLGAAAVAKIKDWLKNLPPNCLKYFKDPRMKQIISELESFINIFKESVPAPTAANPAATWVGRFLGILRDPRIAESEGILLIVKTLSDLLSDMHDLLAIISNGKCNLEFRKFLELLIEFSPFAGVNELDGLKDIFDKVLTGALEPSLALGAMIRKYNPQLAAAWAADCIVRQYGCQTVPVNNQGMTWGEVALWTTFGVGIVAITVFSGGAGTPIALAVTGAAALTSCAGTALADMPDSQIQQLIQERIQQQEDLLNG